jgi:hypothetical protein
MLFFDMGERDAGNCRLANRTAPGLKTGAPAPIGNRQSAIVNSPTVSDTNRFQTDVSRTGFKFSAFQLFALVSGLLAPGKTR